MAESDPYMGNIPTAKHTMPTTASRVSAHKEGATNDMKNRQRTEKAPSFGPLGMTSGRGSKGGGAGKAMC